MTGIGNSGEGLHRRSPARLPGLPRPAPGMCGRCDPGGPERRTCREPRRSRTKAGNRPADCRVRPCPVGTSGSQYADETGDGPAARERPDGPDCHAVRSQESANPVPPSPASAGATRRPCDMMPALSQRCPRPGSAASGAGVGCASPMRDRHPRREETNRRQAVSGPQHCLGLHSPP